jgi:putative endopeptidase
VNGRRVTGITGCAMAMVVAGLVVVSSWNVRAADGHAGPDGTADTLGFDVSHMDKTCKPCDDFFQYVNGNWIKNNPIPPEFASWGSGSMLHDNNQKQLRTLLDEAAANASAAVGSSERKVGDFYASCMDTAAINAQGAHPLDAAFARIAGFKDQDDLASLIAQLHSQTVGALFAFASTQDLKDSSKVIGEADQGGIGLPDRDYYTRTDDDSKKLRDKYVAHVTKMLTLLGDSQEKAAAQAKTVLEIETALAGASFTNVQLRDPETQYHIMGIAQLGELTPHFSWPSYFAEAGHPELKEINIGQPDFFKELDKQIAARSSEQWQAYLRYHLISRTASTLSEPFVEENFDFNARTLAGSKEQQPRWKRCAGATDAYLGEALGQLYVTKYFPPDAKAQVLEMVKNLRAALTDDIPTLSWMSAETKKAALEKLQAFNVKIGYPEKWRDYSALKIDRGPYAQNMLRASAFEDARDLNKIGKPVDRAEWGMTPPTVDAYNNSQLNEIVFPAGILQPPFFDPQRDAAFNYGAMGAIIGHEITHGFDDQGAKFDLHGNMKNWWTDKDLKEFQSRGDCIAKQFDGYVVEGDLHMNGKLVEGESIADLGGLTISYVAYQKFLDQHPAGKDANGFTPEQRFFLGYADAWKNHMRPELAKLQANTNPHPLPKFRANGPLSNMAEFAKAFGCKRGAPMVRADACKIW